MANWKDTTSFSRGDIDRTPRTWHMSFGSITLTVTRHIDYPGTWVTRCDLFGSYSPRDLQTDDVDEAKGIALDMVYTALRVALDAVEAARA